MPTTDLPAKRDRARGRLVDAGDHIEDGGLARAVRADEPDEFALADRAATRSLTAFRPPNCTVHVVESSSGALMPFFSLSEAAARRRAPAAA